MTDATFSQESGYGTTLCSLQDGKKIVPFGQAVAPASLLVQQADKQVKQTTDTYGLNGSASSKSADLQQYLESRLQAQLPKGGLMMFIKGWKRKATPSGRLYCQLQPSVRPIEGRDCTLWATPTTNSNDQPAHTKRGLQTIAGQAKAAMWPTPTATEGGRNKSASEGAAIRPSIGMMAKQMGALWPTPNVRDHKDTPGMAKESINKDGSKRSRMDQLGRVVFGSTAQTESKGSLNPQFPCWLMGIPKEWVSSIVRGMQSLRN